MVRSYYLEWSPDKAVIARWKLCWGLGSRLVREEASEERGLGSQLVLLLEALRIGAMSEVLQVHVGAGLAWPE